MYDIKDIKSRVNCITIARHLSLPINKSGDRCVSPQGGTNPTEFVVYDDRFIDFKHNQSGDVIDFLAYVKFNGDKGESIRYLADLLGISNSNTINPNWKKSVQNQCNLTQSWHEALTAEHLNYLHDRKITDETISFFKIGYNSTLKRIIVPYFKNGYICNWVGRTLSPTAPDNPKYFKPTSNPETAKKHNLDIAWIDKSSPWGLNTFNTFTVPCKPIVITEGTFDALCFYQSGYSVLSPMGGFFSKEQFSTVLSQLKSSTAPIYVCFDSDTAGNNFAFTLAKRLFKHRVEFSILTTPQPFKDVAEAYQNGVELSPENMQPKTSLMFLAEQLTDPDEFADFARQASRFVPKTKLTLLFESVMHVFPKAFLSELKKSCFSAPPDSIIEEEVLSKHQLSHHDSLGFLEYNNTHWVSIPDDFVRQYISDALAIHRTGSKVNSVLTLVRAKCKTTQLFNHKPIMNFVNGTLDLSHSTPVFREHNPADLCTFCLPYPYKPGTYSDNWEQFMNDITNNDPYRYSLLQEAAGYILFPNSELQKCFCLIGEGSNGKSVFLNVITNLIGEENVSNIEMSELGKPFQAIHLMSSLINVSTETKSNVEGSEAIFNQAVVGDWISSCFKGKDMVKFRPRAKLFIACNEFIKSRNATYGFLRRWNFVKFPVRFTEIPEPNNPLDKLADISIEKKLNDPKELSLIFNWVLDGYLLLCQNRYFTETPDQKDIMQNFRENIDPLFAFAEDFVFPNNEEFLPTTELYATYSNWCWNNGYETIAVNVFSRMVKPHLEKKGFELIRTKKCRGYSRKKIEQKIWER